MDRYLVGVIALVVFILATVLSFRWARLYRRQRRRGEPIEPDQVIIWAAVTVASGLTAVIMLIM